MVIATTSYSRTVVGARPADISAARAALNSANEGYSKLKDGPTAEDIAGADAALKNAEASLRSAQSAYDRAYARDPAGIGASPAAVQLEQATNNYNSALNALNMLTVSKLIGSIRHYAAQVELHVVPPLCPMDVSPLDFRHTGALIERAEAQTAEWLARGIGKDALVPPQLAPHVHA